MDYKSKKLENNIGIFLFLIGLICLIITTYIGLTKIAVWSDEIYSIALASLPFNEFIYYSVNDVHPILYYLIYRVFVHIFSFIDVATVGKIVSLIPFYFLFILSMTKIRKNFGMLAAGIFCLLIISMPQMMLYAVEVRMYSWALFFVTASYIYYYDIIQDSSIKSWIIFTLLTICSCYTHYFAVLASISIYIVLLINLIQSNKTLLKKWFISAIVVIIAYLPWIPYLLGQISKSNQFWVDPITGDKIITYIYLMFSPAKAILIFNENILPTVSGTIFLVLIVYLIYKSYSKDKFALDGLKIFLLFMFLGISISIIFHPLFHPRYMIPILGIFWLSVSIFLSKSFDNKKFFIPLLIIILIVGIIGTVYFINSQNNDLIETNDLSNQFNEALGSDNIIFFDEAIPYLKLSQFYLTGNNTCILIDSDDIPSSIENYLHDGQIQQKIHDGADVYYVDSYDSNYYQFNNTNMNLTNITTIIKYDIYKIN